VPSGHLRRNVAVGAVFPRSDCKTRSHETDTFLLRSRALPMAHTTACIRCMHPANSQLPAHERSPIGAASTPTSRPSHRLPRGHTSLVWREMAREMNWSDQSGQRSRGLFSPQGAGAGGAAPWASDVGMQQCSMRHAAMSSSRRGVRGTGGAAVAVAHHPAGTPSQAFDARAQGDACEPPPRFPPNALRHQKQSAALATVV
jgi:hypothetical protein